MKTLNSLLILLVATILHWVAIETFGRVNINVAIMLIFALITANIMSKNTAYAYAFLSGLFLDFFGSVMFGGYALVFVFLIYIFRKFDDKINFSEVGPQLVIPFIFNIMLVLLYGVLGSMFAGKFIWQGARSLVLGSIITALLLPILYRGTEKFLIFTKKTR